MPTRIAVIAEADIDRRQICEMVDRKICDHAPDWWDDGQLDAEREYCGLTPGSMFTRWRDLRSLERQGALRRGGFIGFNNVDSGRFDYPMGRKALLLCAEARPQVDAVILIRDMDNQPSERRASLVDVRAEFHGHLFSVVLALPSAKREAWVLNGFEPQDAAEKRAFAEVRSQLAFHPLEKAEDLDATTPGSVRCAKRVLKALTADDREREALCWRAAKWELMRFRGKGSGLTNFLAEVKETLVPLVTGTGAR